QAHAFEDLTQPLWRYRQLGNDAGHAERVIDGRGDRGANGVDTALARTFQAERIERRRRVFSDQDVERRHFARRGHEVIGEVDRNRLARLVVEESLEYRAAYPRREPAGELPFDEHRIDRAADVVGENITLDRHAASLAIDLGDGDVHAVGIGHVVAEEPAVRRQAGCALAEKL